MCKNWKVYLWVEIYLYVDIFVFHIYLTANRSKQSLYLISDRIALPTIGDGYHFRFQIAIVSNLSKIQTTKIDSMLIKIYMVKIINKTSKIAWLR